MNHEHKAQQLEHKTQSTAAKRAHSGGGALGQLSVSQSQSIYLSQPARPPFPSTIPDPLTPFPGADIS